jgi:putative Holliday junction resolvase
MAIDYGSKKCGIAVSDPLRIIATGLDTVPTEELMEYLKDYFEQEPVGTLVLGESLHKDGTPTNIHSHAVGFSRRMSKLYPNLEIEWQDEFNTSQRARAIMFETLPKKKRQQKERVDKIAAVLILQDFMEANR